MAKRTPRIFSTADGVTVADLLHFGLDNLSAAEALLKSSARHFDSAGYVAHLGIELLLKAWHLQGLNSFPGVHSIIYLWSELRKSLPIRQLSRRDLETLALLDDYAELRYPNLNYPIEIGSDDSPRIGALCTSLLKRMPRALHQAIEGLHWSRKGGRVLMEKPIPKKRRVAT